MAANILRNVPFLANVDVILNDMVAYFQDPARAQGLLYT